MQGSLRRLHQSLITRWRNNGSSTGLPVSVWYPRHLDKRWTRYQINRQVGVSYYTRLGGPHTYNTYGGPCNVALTLRARY